MARAILTPLVASLVFLAAFPFATADHGGGHVDPCGGGGPGNGEMQVYCNYFYVGDPLEGWTGAGILETPNFAGVLASADSGCWYHYELGSSVCGQRPFDENDAATLTLDNLPGHALLRLSLELYTLHAMDGNEPNGFGPDMWDVDATGVASDIQPPTTFANVASFRQDFPDAYQCAAAEPGCVVSNLGTAGSAASGDLLELGTSSNGEIPAVRYDLSYTFAHTADNVTFTFRGTGLQVWQDEGWVIDAVRVTSIVTPPSEPLNVQAIPGPLATFGRTEVTWEPAANNGGSPPGYNSYRVCRGTAAGGPYPACVWLNGQENLYVDNTVAPFSTYYYVVYASNMVGEGPASAEDCTKPSPWLAELPC